MIYKNIFSPPPSYFYKKDMKKIRRLCNFFIIYHSSPLKISIMKGTTMTYLITITQTRSITIPCKADSPEQALTDIAKTYYTDHHSALGTDADWPDHSLTFSCEPIPPNTQAPPSIHLVEYD